MANATAESGPHLRSTVDLRRRALQPDKFLPHIRRGYHGDQQAPAKRARPTPGAKVPLRDGCAHSGTGQEQRKTVGKEHGHLRATIVSLARPRGTRLSASPWSAPELKRTQRIPLLAESAAVPAASVLHFASYGKPFFGEHPLRTR